jgi:hypothetical protein
MLNLLKGIIGPILGPLVEKIPDPNERRRLQAAAEAQLLTSVTSLVEGQIRINEKEAQHGSIFVAGARPFILWVCGVALAYNFIVYPLLLWIAFIVPGGSDLATAPKLDTEDLYTVLLGMLGLGTMRSFEKRHGVARTSLGNGKDGK